jgi:putative ABC transport system substrate-binding protein
MKRRELLILMAALVARVLPASGQQTPRQARLGWLAHGDTLPRHFFDDALAKLGWIEGKNLTIERRFSGVSGEELEVKAAELVTWQPDVIVALGIVDAKPLVALSRTIPIVVVIASNPVGQGLVASLDQPGGNVTGTASITVELLPKLFELVKQLIPAASRVSVLGDPKNPGNVEPPASLGEALSLKIISRHASRPEQLDAAFAAAVADHDQAMVVQHVAITFEERRRVAALAERFRLPTVCPFREYAEVGGLISYGPSLPDLFRRSADYVDKILRGAKPADIPVEQPTTFELVINLKTATTLGLTVPQSLLARADEVIE